MEKKKKAEQGQTSKKAMSRWATNKTLKKIF